MSIIKWNIRVIVNIIRRVGFCCLLVLLSVSVRAEDKPEAILDRAERLVSLRDRIIAEYSLWSEEYAKEDTPFAKRQRAHYEQFGKRVDAVSNPAAAPKGGSGVKIKFIYMSGIRRPDYQGVSTKTVLDLSSGTLREGPDWAALKKESAESGRSMTSLLAREVGRSGDIGFLEYELLIPSGRYVNLGNGNLHYYSGVDLCNHVEEHDPTCIFRMGEVLVIETAQKKYALVQYLGKYQKQALLAVAYQPNGSAVWEFGSSERPKELDIRNPEINLQDFAETLLVYNREMFFLKEARELVEPLKIAEKDSRLTESQRKKVKDIMKKLGTAE
jgi:hypothetical protein